MAVNDKIIFFQVCEVHSEPRCHTEHDQECNQVYEKVCKQVPIAVAEPWVQPAPVYAEEWQGGKGKGGKGKGGKGALKAGLLNLIALKLSLKGKGGGGGGNYHKRSIEDLDNINVYEAALNADLVRQRRDHNSEEHSEVIDNSDFLTLLRFRIFSM